jgi:flagellar basal-body rod protein FlgF
MLSPADPTAASSSVQSLATDFSAGKSVETGNAYDLAIVGDGLFTVRGADRTFYTRQGQFQRDTDGRLVTAQGLALQTDSGDLVLKGGKFEVTADGMVLEDGAPVARLAIASLAAPERASHIGGSLFAAAPEDVTPALAPAIRQGVLESSNVSTADEMVAIMSALRRAESAQRLVGVYDDLMGRALTTFGQA